MEPPFACRQAACTLSRTAIPAGGPRRRSFPQRQVSRFFATFAGIMKGFRRWVSPAAVACVAVAMLAVAMAAEAAGQAKIMTKKFRLSDFTDRVTKVVLSGNEMMDSALKMEVSERWTVSPFEFCTAGEFAALKQSDRYYFLLVTMQDPAMRFLTLAKGGAAGSGDKKAAGSNDRKVGSSDRKASGNGDKKVTGNNKAAAEGIEGMMEVVSVPLGSDRGFGRELFFLPALLEIVQDFTLRAMEKELIAYSGLSIYNVNYRKDGRIKRICLSLGDIAPQVGAVQMGNLDEDILLVEEEEADAAFQQGSFNTLVSFVVTPEGPAQGAWCYKMLIDAETHRLYYFKRHRISDKKGAGFLPQDLRRLSKGR